MMGHTVFVSFSLFLSFRLIAAVQVKIEQGTLDGAVSYSRNGSEYYSFYGIPYAKPPIDQLRFEPPKEVDPWKGVRDAKTPPSPCLQADAFNFHATVHNSIVGQEDCLYLDVFTSNITSSPKLPVMVNIHGGAFQTGFSHMLGPEYFMDHAVVVVNLQYRLAIFGFLSAADEILPGNYGMKDQVAALRWVQKNIAAFGGDPKRVTIVGESAGAASVHFHMHSPLSTGLFHRAVIQSGSSLASWALTKSETARNRAHALGVLSGCPKLETRALVECLRRVPAKQLVEAHSKFFVHDLFPVISFAPVVESKDVPNAFLTQNPWNQDPINGVPLIAGITKDEGGVMATRIRSMPTELDYWNSHSDQLLPLALYYEDSTNSSAISASLKKFYFGNVEINSKTGENLSEMFMDGFMMVNTLEAARRHNNKVFLYLYDHQNNHTFNVIFGNLTEDLGVCHADDLLSHFHLHNIFPPVTEGPDLAVSQRFVNYWMNFLKTDDPNGNVTIWQPLSDKFEYLHIMTNSDRMEKELFRDRYNFWMNVRSYP